MWHGYLVHFANIANYTSLSVKELSANKETTCKRQNHIFLSNKYTCKRYIKRYKQQKWTFKNC